MNNQQSRLKTKINFYIITYDCSVKMHVITLWWQNCVVAISVKAT